MGEEGFERFNELTSFRERKARVTEVSRALKAAAKEEYLKRKQEKKQELEAAKAESVHSVAPQEQGARSEGDTSTEELPVGGRAEKFSMPSSFRNPFGGKGSEAGKQTMNSFLGLMDAMKEKAKGSRAEYADA